MSKIKQTTTHLRKPLSSFPVSGGILRRAMTPWILVLMASVFSAYPAGLNLLRNAGFEEPASGVANVSGWSVESETPSAARLVEQSPHSGRQCLVLPARAALTQKVVSVEAGAYIARCWIKSTVEQFVTFLIKEPDRPWLGYSCTELKVPKDHWVQLEAFCCLARKGSLSLNIGGVSREFRNYHGAGSEMGTEVLLDDCELVRQEPDSNPNLCVWDAGKELAPDFVALENEKWRRVEASSTDFQGTPVFQDRYLVGKVRLQDGSLALYSLVGDKLKPRAVLTPEPALGKSGCSLINSNGQTGLRIASILGDSSYIVWMTPKGIIEVESQRIPHFRLAECSLSYGLLPGFVGTDLCYAPQKLSTQEVRLPSTQWFVGLVKGNDSMLVAVWDSNTQAVSLGLKGQETNRLIESFSITPESKRFALSFVEHPNLWHREELNEDWLSEYVPIGWQRPFAARWMGQFFVSPSARPSFREPNMSYSFPFATAKTRLWGVWFEDWNYFPFYFEGEKTIFHFDKSFAPNGDALIYFLEPAAANLYSPCEIVEQVLGEKRAAELFDFDANQIRRLKYSTPDEFIYDRPVCATTTRLSKISAADKPTVGVNLATHLYEFIREIRARVEQYESYFLALKDYLTNEKQAHPESEPFIAPLLSQIAEAQAKATEIHAVPLSDVQQKTESMKAQLLAGKGEGFDCGKLDVRSPAGAQDDLCRRYNRLVLKLTQLAALNCGDSAENAKIAQHMWTESRKILRLPTRWEPRRTLYFFEP